MYCECFILSLKKLKPACTDKVRLELKGTDWSECNQNEERSLRAALDTQTCGLFWDQIPEGLNERGSWWVSHLLTMTWHGPPAFCNSKWGLRLWKDFGKTKPTLVIQTKVSLPQKKNMRYSHHFLPASQLVDIWKVDWLVTHRTHRHFSQFK